MSSILIIGGGLAGLFTALKLAPLPCTVLTPTPLGEGASSAWAQGGVAAAIGEGDSIDSHVADTLRAGAGLCHEGMVQLMVAEASDRILDLLGYGVPFDRDLEGKLVQSREAAHSHNRVVRVRGDMAGRKIMEALIAAVRQTPSIRVVEGAEALDLAVEGRGVTGVQVARNGRLEHYRAARMILATGGAGQIFAVTTNPLEARGAGLSMAWRAGATIINPEFVQFHPTALDIGRDPAPLATEALRGEGAWLIDRKGERFMLPLHKDAELAPRDVVARGVFVSLQSGNGAFLDCRAAIGDRFSELFPTVHAACLQAGIDSAREPIPVAPAAHYHMGGIEVDENGRVRGLSGLFAVGEVAHTGVHGANRLASNSLLEAVVFGARAAQTIRMEHASFGMHEQPRMEDIGPHRSPEPETAARILGIRRLMQDACGVLRNAGGLRQALVQLEQPAASTGTLASFAQVAQLMVKAALAREESRGGHSRTDFPDLGPEALWTRLDRASGLSFCPPG